MDLHEYAENELQKMGLFSDEGDFYGGLTGMSVMQLIDTFADQQHSSASASRVLKIFKRLTDFKPISPLTGEDDEWEEFKNGQFQNKRCPMVFKNGKNGKAYNIYGKVFSNDGGKTWWSNGNSKVYIEFPYIVPDKPEEILLEKL